MPLMNAVASAALASQPESIATSAPFGMRPWRRSQRRRSSLVTSVAGSLAARSEMSTTTSGRISSCSVISSEVRPPATKCPGTSMCVAVCSQNVHCWP